MNRYRCTNKLTNRLAFRTSVVNVGDSDLNKKLKLFSKKTFKFQEISKSPDIVSFYPGG